jgi:Major Facilitator Superfamily
MAEDDAPEGAPDGALSAGAAGPDRPAGAGVLAAACISALIVNANTSAVTILLPAISKDVGAPVAQLQWAVTGYSLVGAAVIVTSGALGDVFGRRRLFLAGLALFIASCVLIALSTSGAGVVIGRMIRRLGRDDPGLRDEPAVRRRVGRRADARDNHLGGGIRGWCGGGAVDRWRARRPDRLAGAVLDRCGDRCRVRAADAQDRPGAAIPIAPARSIMPARC